MVLDVWFDQVASSFEDFVVIASIYRELRWSLPELPPFMSRMKRTTKISDFTPTLPVMPLPGLVADKTMHSTSDSV